MKLEIKDPRITIGELEIDVLKMEFRTDPLGIARFSIPYSEMDRLTIAGVRCPGLKSLAIVRGNLNDKPITVVFAGRSTMGVKHGRRGISFDLDLEHFELHWMSDEKPREKLGEQTDGENCKDGVVAVAISEGAVEDPA